MNVEEVLSADHRARLMFGERSANGVGADGGFVPRRAGDKGDVRRLVGETALAESIENQAMRIGQDNDPGRAPGVAIKRLHFADRRTQQRLVELLRFASMCCERTSRPGLAVLLRPKAALRPHELTIGAGTGAAARRLRQEFSPHGDRFRSRKPRA